VHSLPSQPKYTIHLLPTRHFCNTKCMCSSSEDSGSRYVCTASELINSCTTVLSHVSQLRWKRCITHTRAVQLVATCRSAHSPHSHYDITCYWARHVQRYGRTLRTDTLPQLIYKDVSIHRSMQHISKSVLLKAECAKRVYLKTKIVKFMSLLFQLQQRLFTSLQANNSASKES